MGLFDSITQGVSSIFGGGGEKKPAAEPEHPPAPGPGGGPPPPAADPTAIKKPTPDPKLVAGAADSLDKAMKGWGTDEASIHNALRGKSPEEIAAIKTEYAKKYGKSLDAELKSELSGDDLKEAQAYMANDPVKAATTALKAASKGLGTDEDKLMATLKGMSPDQAAAVRAAYKKETGQSLDKMLDEELSGKDLKAAQEQLAGKFTTGLGKDIDELAKKSPTLVGKLNQIADEGWTITYGTKGKGTFADPAKKTIVIDPDKTGDTMGIVKSLSHEAGHAAYTLDPYVPPKGLTKDDYVAQNTTRNLKDEGEATITNMEVRKELLAAKAGDIGVSGAKAEEYKKLHEKYPDPKDRDKLRAEIGKVFAKGEVPSTPKKDGTMWKDYGEYYGQTYVDFWDKNVTPGKDGKAPAPMAPLPGPDADHDHSGHDH